MKKKMKVFVWEDVLTDYTSGMMVSIAPNVDKARELLLKKCDYIPVEDLMEEPQIFDLDSEVAFYVWGGG